MLRQFRGVEHRRFVVAAFGVLEASFLGEADLSRPIQLLDFDNGFVR
jgi:hypothetical protein